MKQHHLTSQNQYVIKEIARSLPDMPIGVYNRNKVPKNQDFIKIAAWLFTRKWPNGKKVIGKKTVIWIQKKFFGLMDHDRSHERRLRRAYQRNGILGVANYLKTIGIGDTAVSEWIDDFEHSNMDIRAIKKFEKSINKKILVE